MEKTGLISYLKKISELVTFLLNHFLSISVEEIMRYTGECIILTGYITCKYDLRLMEVFRWNVIFYIKRWIESSWYIIWILIIMIISLMILHAKNNVCKQKNCHWYHTICRIMDNQKQLAFGYEESIYFRSVNNQTLEPACQRSWHIGR